MQQKIKVKTNGVSTIKGHTKLSCNHKKDEAESSDGTKPLTPESAEAMLCGRRLEVTMKQNDEQMQLSGMEPDPIHALCDVKSFSSKPNGYSWAFVFDEDEMPIENLKHMQFTDLVLDLKLVGEAGPDEDGDDDTEEMFDEGDEDDND